MFIFVLKKYLVYSFYKNYLKFKQSLTKKNKSNDFIIIDRRGGSTSLVASGK
jgi:hypothetical protein